MIVETKFRKKSSNRKLLYFLFKKYNKLCCYCGCKTVMNKSGISSNKNPKLATIEHVYTSYSIFTLLTKNKHKTILACAKCNHKKGVNDYNKLMKGFNYCDSPRMLLNFLKNNNEQF